MGTKPRLRASGLGRWVGENFIKAKGITPISRKRYNMRNDYRLVGDWERHTVAGLTSRQMRPEKPGVAPAEVMTIIFRTQVPFMGQRLAVAQECASYFSVCGLRAGVYEMTPSVEEIPAEVFASPRLPKEFERNEMVDGDGIARGERFDIRPIMPGECIYLIVRNDMIYTHHPFKAAVFGRSPKNW